ncbi:hypothetical protein NGRA_1780 [Nosema granulosis]|uniref:Uncharacterized protein n=1 Tax=Nosema granulosis TaxID=83296 RepID=A0A9P6KZ17_9MICR|nr:hypothetical protein NGRA_1780 [Nosema granulosis]
MTLYQIYSQPNLNISCFEDENLYSVENNRISKRYIFDFDKPTPLGIQVDEPIDCIYAVENLFILFCMNVVYTYEIGSWKLRGREVLPAAIKKHKKSANHLLILTDSDKLFIFRSGKITPVYVHKKGMSQNDTVVDICTAQDTTYILSSEGLVFRTHSVLLTSSVLLYRPLKMIPEPSSCPHSIHSHNNNIFLAYADGVEVYSVHGSILYLSYRYNTEFYKIVENEGVYCLDKTVNILGRFPKVVLNAQAVDMFGRFCITKDVIYEIPEDSISFENDNSGTTTFYSEKNFIDLFRSLRAEFTIRDCTEKELFEDFDRTVLDNYRKFYLELRTANESIVEKKEKLDKLEKKIIEKAIRVDDRRNKLVERMREAVSRYNSILKTQKIDGSKINQYIRNIEEKIKKSPKGRFGNFKSLLVTQRNLLTAKLQENN